MSLPGGSRLGPYELLAPIGAGGMGEVYKARDTRLDRTVAIKVLPSELAKDPERRARLEREARAISSLNHPNICTLFDVGNQDGVEFLVMEHLDGESLDKRLAKGPLPPEQTFQIGIEIASALERAHRQGIIHRDLKPANIMLTRGGAKLLDFGIAKAVQGLAPMLEKTTPAGTPTLRPLTGEGTIVGSLHYMAPEQLEGREADARSDIFGLGVVLYEMATGRRAFEGASQASVIAAILERQPTPISVLQPVAPAAFERLVRVCLAKDPDERWQSAHDVRAQLQGIAESSTLSLQAAAPVRRRWKRERWAWTALAALLVAGWTARELARPKVVAARATVRAAVLPPAGVSSSGPLALSPDGQAVAFVGYGDDGVARLFLRGLSEPEARLLPGTDDASLPFWAPDGRALGFFAQRQLKRVEIAGGPPHVLADVSDARGGTWGPGGRIVFAPNPGDGLYGISAEGGPAQPLTHLDAARGESSHRWPTLLPDGKHVVYLALSGQRERTSLQAASVGAPGAPAVAGERLLPADSGAAYAGGILFFVRGQNLLGQRVDPRTLALAGEPVPIAEGVWRDPDLDGLRALSAAGDPGGQTIAYRLPGLEQARLVRFDREGKELHTIGAPGVGGAIGLSPDGKRIARSLTAEGAATAGLWLLDASAQSSPTRLTFNRWNDIYPVWSPDGRRIAFASDRTGSYNLFEKPIDGSGSETQLHVSEAWEFPEDWSRDGRALVFTRRDPRTKSDVWMLGLPDRQPRALLATEADELQPRLSPDGRFVAYASDESGRSEIYVQTVPPTSAKWQISTAGAFQPQWRRDGGELYYLGLDLKLMAVEVALRNGAFTFKPAQALFLTHTRRSALKGATEFVASPDGKQFVIDATAGADLSTPIQLIVGWQPPN